MFANSLLGECPVRQTSRFFLELYSSQPVTDEPQYAELMLLHYRHLDISAEVAKIKNFLAAEKADYQFFFDRDTLRLFVEMSRKDKMVPFLKSAIVFQKIETNAYFTPHLYNKRDGKFVCADLRLFYIDIDFKDSTKDSFKQIASFEEALVWFDSKRETFLRIIGCVPAAVFSGNGIHLYFNPQQKITENSTEWNELQDALRDSGIFEAYELVAVDNKPLHNRVSKLRLPFSKNYKNADDVREVRILSFSDYRTPDINLLNKIRLRKRDSQKFVRRAADSVKQPVGSFQITESAIDEASEIFGKYYRPGHHHNLSFSFISHCAKQNLDAQNIFEILVPHMPTTADQDSLERRIEDAFYRLETNQPVTGFMRFQSALEESGLGLRKSADEITSDLSRISALVRNPENFPVASASNTDALSLEDEIETTFDFDDFSSVMLLQISKMPMLQRTQHIRKLSAAYGISEVTLREHILAETLRPAEEPVKEITEQAVVETEAETADEKTIIFEELSPLLQSMFLKFFPDPNKKTFKFESDDAYRDEAVEDFESAFVPSLAELGYSRVA